MGLKDFVEGRSPMPDIRELSEDEFDMDRMLGIEQEEYRKHVKLWEEGKIDLSVTRFSSIVPALQKAGVKVSCPFPSKQYVGEIGPQAPLRAGNRVHQERCVGLDLRF